MPSDEVGGGWHLDEDTQRALRGAAARDALRRRDFARAILEAEEILDRVPDDKDALGMVAEASMELRDFEVAREAWWSLIDAGEERAAVWSQLGVCAFESCQFSEARRAALRALELYEDDGDACFLMGMLAQRSGDVEAAWTWFERAHRISPLAYPLPLWLTDTEVDDVLAAAFGSLDHDVRAFWAQVPITRQDFPDAAELTAPVPSISPRVLALYEGPAPAPHDVTSFPPSLRLYVGNLAHQDSPAAAAEALAEALEQEFLDWRPDPDAADDAS